MMKSEANLIKGDREKFIAAGMNGLTEQTG